MELKRSFILAAVSAAAEAETKDYACGKNSQDPFCYHDIYDTPLFFDKKQYYKVYYTTIRHILQVFFQRKRTEMVSALLFNR